MKPSPTLTAALSATLLGAALIANAAPLKTDAAHSTVSAVFKQMDVPVESNFKRFTAQIDYDAAHPEKATARVDIDTASFDMGQADYNKEIAKKEWFNSAQFPKASFVSSSIKPAGAGKLAVAGKLTIKGKTLDVSFPLTVKPQGGKQVFEGQLPIKRLAFNVGEGEWQDTSMVADEVLIKFRVAAGQ
ncbi:YceI family protein [Massilia aerilata]|uniref:YceI family protein n=1 Tax=Massilia aerilata TaxID=453817 RepID=A0ABW0RZ56_9BURK